MRSYKSYSIFTKERRHIRNKTRNSGTIRELVQLSLLSTYPLIVPVSLLCKRECWNDSDRGMPKFPEKWYCVHHKSPTRTGPEDEPGPSRWDDVNSLNHGTVPRHSGNNSTIKHGEIASYEVGLTEDAHIRYHTGTTDCTPLGSTDRGETGETVGWWLSWWWRWWWWMRHRTTCISIRC